MTADKDRAAGTLYVVATPIGNLDDITCRAVQTLKDVDLIAAEDTRHSRKLLDRFNIKKPMVSYHDHNERQRQESLLGELEEGKNVAVISDAGTPCIADPGYRLVASCRSCGIRVVPVPGASAMVAALSVAGVPTDRFSFEGYLPSKARARIKFLKTLEMEQRTLVFYETPHRLQEALSDFLKVMGGDRSIVIAREMTKLHEEFFHATIAGAVDHFAGKPVKGEFVLMLPPAEDVPRISVREALHALLQEGDMTRREAVKLIAKEYDLPSSEVYSLSLRLTEDDTDE